MVMVGFGAGLTWGAVVWHWQPVETDTAAILVEDWPIPQRLQSSLRRVRTQAARGPSSWAAAKRRTVSGSKLPMSCKV